MACITVPRRTGVEAPPQDNVDLAQDCAPLSTGGGCYPGRPDTGGFVARRRGGPTRVCQQPRSPGLSAPPSPLWFAPWCTNAGVVLSVGRSSLKILIKKPARLRGTVVFLEFKAEFENSKLSGCSLMSFSTCCMISCHGKALQSLGGLPSAARVLASHPLARRGVCVDVDGLPSKASEVAAIVGAREGQDLQRLVLQR